MWLYRIIIIFFNNYGLLSCKKKSVSCLIGMSGTLVDVKANYFTVETTPKWCLYQYHVDFSPDEDSTAVRKALMRIHAKTFGG